MAVMHFSVDCSGSAEFVGILVQHQNVTSLTDLDTRGPGEQYFNVYHCLRCDRWSYLLIENPTEDQRLNAVLGFGPFGD